MSTFELTSMIDGVLGMLEFHWGAHEDEPLLIANRLDFVREGLEHAEFPMMASREIVVGDMKDRFDAEVDLDGKPWKKRSKATLDSYRKTHQVYGTILRKDDHLYEAVTNPDSYDVIDNDMFINTSTWPVYWHIHDQGGTAGRGVKIPARPYVGISEQAQFDILAVFDQWIERDIQFVAPGVTGVMSFRGAFGRITGPVTREGLIPQRPGVFVFGQGD